MDNPYASSAVDPVSHGSPGTITPGILQALAGTRPWVRLCSVLGFITTGLIFIAAIVMMLVGGTGAAGGGGLRSAGFMAGMGFFYVLLGALYLFPSIKLWRYGSHIVSLMNSQSTADLEAALDAQRSFWKFVGVMVCIMIGLYAVMLVVGMAGAFLS